MSSDKMQGKARKCIETIICETLSDCAGSADAASPQHLDLFVNTAVQELREITQGAPDDLDKKIVQIWEEDLEKHRNQVEPDLCAIRDSIMHFCMRVHKLLDDLDPQLVSGICDASPNGGCSKTRRQKRRWQKKVASEYCPVPPISVPPACAAQSTHAFAIESPYRSLDIAAADSLLPSAAAPSTAADVPIAPSLRQSLNLGSSDKCGRKGDGYKDKGEGSKGQSAAGVILLVGQGTAPTHVVITFQDRKRRGQSWELPKGGAEARDQGDLKATATREFVEETGVQNQLGMLTEVPVQYGNNRTKWFLGRVDDVPSLQWGEVQDKDTMDVKCVDVNGAVDILRDDHKQLLCSVLDDVRAGRL